MYRMVTNQIKKATIASTRTPVLYLSQAGPPTHCVRLSDVVCILLLNVIRLIVS